LISPDIVGVYDISSLAAIHEYVFKHVQFILPDSSMKITFVARWQDGGEQALAKLNLAKTRHSPWYKKLGGIKLNATPGYGEPAKRKLDRPLQDS
jgi:hypothetical protein